MRSVYFSHSNHLFRKLLIASFLIALVASGISTTFSNRAEAAGSDTCTWTGAGSSAAWNEAANWSACSGGVPVNGDSIYFPVSAPNKVSVNDIAGLSLKQIRFGGDDYALTGSSVDLTPNTLFAVMFDGFGNNLGLDFTISASSSRTIYSADDNAIGGNMTLNIVGGGLNINPDNDKTLTFNGSVSGSVTGTLKASENSSTTVFNGASDFTATSVSIPDATNVICAKHDCFGASTNVINLNGTGRLTFGLPFIDNDSIIDNDIVAEGGGTIDAVEQTAAQLNGNLILDGDLTIAGTGNISQNGTTDLGTNTIYLTSGLYETDLWGTVTGDGNIDCDGCFSGMGPGPQNDFTGTVNVHNSGILYITSPYSLGSTVGETTVEDGSMLEFGMMDTNTVPVAENITISGAGRGAGVGVLHNYSANDVYYSGTITLDGDSTLATDDGSMFNVSGEIGGTGDLTLVGNDPESHFDFTGNGANDYIGATNVNGVVLNLLGANDVVSIPGDININAIDAPAQVNDQRFQKISDISRITMTQSNASAILRIQDGVYETVGMIEGEGSLIIDSADQPFNVGGGDLSGTFAGSISAPETIIAKVGTGDWNLTGTLNANGGLYPIFQVQQGRFLFNFEDTSGQNAGIILSQGVLGGSGIIGEVNAQTGTIAPGNSPGCLYPAGSLTLNSTITVSEQINGSTPCSGYDQLNVAGAVDLNGATLNASLGYTPAGGATFDIVSGASVTGIFNSLPNNSTFTVSGRTFTINYSATKVTLTASAEVIAAPTSASGLLSSTGANILIALLAVLILMSTGAFLYLKFRRHKKIYV